MKEVFYENIELPTQKRIEYETSITTENDKVIIKQGNKCWKFNLKDLQDANIIFEEDKVIVKQEKNEWVLRFNQEGKLEVNLNTVAVNSINGLTGEVKLNGENLLLSGFIPEQTETLFNAISGIKANASTLENNVNIGITEIKNRLDTLHGENASLNSKIDTISGILNIQIVDLTEKLEECRISLNEEDVKIHKRIDIIGLASENTIEKVEKNISEIAEIKTKLNKIDTKIEELETKSSVLENKLVLHSNEIENLKNQNTTIITENSSLKEQINSLTTKISTIENTVMANQTIINSNKTLVEAVANDLNILIQTLKDKGVI